VGKRLKVGVNLRQASTVGDRWLVRCSLFTLRDVAFASSSTLSDFQLSHNMDEQLRFLE
jgi:hypothetical protein